MSRDIVGQLERRLGPAHAQLRLGIEDNHEEHIFGPVRAVMQGALKMAGLYERGRRNAERIHVRHNRVRLRSLPALFDGFTILHISDMHVDLNPGVMARLIELLPDVTYDICVLTGDFRGRTFGPFDATLDGLARVRERIDKPVYGVLGNHDTIRMVPGLEAMDIRMLLNESETIARGHQRLHLAGIDDAHYHRADNIEKAASGISPDDCAVLLSHTPEVYRRAADADFSLLLGGHTHGGQICLPGSLPMTLGSVLPRHMGAGAWRYRTMAGYTSVGIGASVVPVRFNCPPEITLHRLLPAS